MAPAAHSRGRIRAGSRWTAGAALLAVGDWARSRGVDAGQAVLVHDGRQVLVRLGDVALTVTAPRDAEQALIAHRLLGALPGLDLPQVTEPHETTVGTVTATPWPSMHRLVEPGEAGDLLRRWHQRPVHDVSALPSWTSVHLPTSDVGEGVLHGAVRPSRFARWQGRPVLLGLDGVCRGPRELDLVPLALLTERRGWSQASYSAFSRAYGHDVRRWAGFEAAALLVEDRELARQVESGLQPGVALGDRAAQPCAGHRQDGVAA